MRGIFDKHLQIIEMNLNKLKLKHIAFLILSLVVIIIPRFNWGEVGPLKPIVGIKPFDIEQYVDYTEFFRGEMDDNTRLEGPFVYRPLVPFLASFLPFDALTSINIINLIVLLLTLIPLIKMLQLLKLKSNYVFIGGLLFVYSFPLFYYGSSGYIDSVLIGFIMMAVFLMLSNKIILFFAVFTLGIGVKETIVILIPVFAIYLFFQSNFSLKKNISLLLLLILVYSICMILLRNITPESETYIWLPSLEVLTDNLARPKTYLSILLAFGIPGIGALLYIYVILRKHSLISQQPALVTGLIVSMLISFFSLFAAYADGRHIWTSYPFSIPLALLFLKMLKESDTIAHRFPDK